MAAHVPAGQVGDTDQSEADHAGLDGTYWRLWWANAINNIGDGVFVVALPLLAVTFTTDPRSISIIAAAAYVPLLLLSLPAGVIVDRYDRVALMWRCQAFQAVIVAAAAAATAAGHANIPVLVMASFLLGSAQVVIANAAESVLPLYVRPRLLQRANGNLYVGQTLGQWTLGPALGSLLFAAAATLPFGLDAASFVFSAALLATLPRVGVRRGGRSSMWAEISEGLSWLRKHRLLRTLAVMLGMNTFCFQMGFATLVLFVTQTLRLSKLDYGLMLAGVGVGGIAGGLINSLLARRLGALPALMTSYAATAIIYIGIGLAPNGAVVSVLMAVAGLTVTVTGVVTTSLRQQIVPDELLGRVSSVYRMLGWGFMPLGSLVGGFTAQLSGLRAPLLGAGAIRLAVLAAALPILIPSTQSLKGELSRSQS